MKIKGAGVLCLLVISISGIIYVAHLISITEKSTVLFLPLLFLLYITYQLINLAHALFRTGTYIDTS